MSRLAPCVAAALALARLVAAGTARAQDLPLELAWQAPRECPQAQDIQAELSRLARPRPGIALAPLRANGQIEHARQGYVLRLATTTRGEHGRTVLEAARCADLQRAATLVLALIFGDAVDLVEPTQSAPPPVEPLARPPVALRASPTRRSEPVNSWLGGEAGVAAELGLMPNLGLGPGAGLLLQRQRWLLRAGGSLLFSTSHELTERVSVSFWAASLRAAACYRWQTAVWSAGACVGGDLGTLHGSARGASRNGSAFAPWYALSPSLLVGVRSSARWEWLLGVGAQLAPVPPRFEVNGLSQGFQAAHVAPFVSLSVALH